MRRHKTVNAGILGMLFLGSLVLVLVGDAVQTSVRPAIAIVASN